MIENELVRLQKYIADCGVVSRRKAEELILENKVKVNEKIVNKMGAKINPFNDLVKVNDKLIKLQSKRVYILLNKPVGFITSTEDELDRPTVLDLVQIQERIFPVGRLDLDTSGLLILTNDGDLSHKLMHPSHDVDKKYVVDVLGVPTFKKIDALRRGVKIEDYKTSPANMEIIKSRGNSTVFEITIHEGRNRQVRKMFELIGHPVLKLKRIAIGTLVLGRLKEGMWRNLKQPEIDYLKSL